MAKINDFGFLHEADTPKEPIAIEERFFPNSMEK